MASTSTCEDDDVEAGNGKYDFSKYLRLYIATVQGNWEEAQKFLDQHQHSNPTNESLGLARLNDNLETVLHVAARAGNASFAAKLVSVLDDCEVLSFTNRYGQTPLHIAARYGNIKVAQILVEKSYMPLYYRDMEGFCPIHHAARNFAHSKEVFCYFFHVTHDQYYDPDWNIINPFLSSSGAAILADLIESKFYDMALMLVEKYPDVSYNKIQSLDISPLEAMIVAYDYRSINKSTLSFWQRFIYNYVSKRSTESSTPSSLISSLVEFLLLKSIANKILMHEQAVRFLKDLCRILRNLNVTHFASKELIFRAAELDMDEVILNIVEAYSTIFYFKDEKSGHNILHIAIQNRSENVFNLICGTSALMHELEDVIDKKGNNIMHLAGKLAPPHKLNSISGAALQMQREIQWFKEVQKIAPAFTLSWRNEDLKTPNMVFTEEHTKLKEAGEKWMKEIATSCSVAATLIVTVVFAAAITVPGGNNAENGHPIFSKRAGFTIFGISNAASLFTSATSLLVFLSIFTSRYAEEDFLYALPKRLIIGLLTLFLSIISLMVAFSTIIYLVFGQNKAWVVITVAALACLPVASFVFLQFPLLAALVRSTYWPGIFKKQGIPKMLF